MTDAFDVLTLDVFEEAPRSGGLTSLQQKAHNIEAADYALIPLGSNGNPQPYAKGQKYPASMVSRDADRFGVRLDGVILLDYDGNKTPGIMSVVELFEKLGITATEEEILDAVVQFRIEDGKPDGSYHWLFSLPVGYDTKGWNQSVTGALEGVDIKTGNQLIYIKADKTLPGDTFPPLSELLEAPPALLEFLKPTAPARTEFAPVALTGETTPYGAAALASALEVVANAPQGHRNETLNRETMKVAQLVAGGEIAANDAAELERAALASGMTRAEVVATIKSAINKGMSEPRKAPERKAVVQRQTGRVVALHPERNVIQTQDLDHDTLSKMPASSLGRLLASLLGPSAVCHESGIVYQYVDGVWLPVPDPKLTPMLAKVFDAIDCPYTAKKLNGAVETMKIGLPEMGLQVAGMIGFANGVYDLKAKRFLSHSPDHYLPSHNGIEYCAAMAGEALKQDAPSFYRWLSHAAGGNSGKIDRILAALYMVLANRYDWQLFLEVTGEGGSGKSVMANLCELLVGKENVGSTSMEAMRGAFGLENVWDKRLILLPDQSQYIGDGALLKAITGGDEVPINRKGKAVFGAKVRAVVLATNNEPMKMTERNGGISRRRVIFAFNNVVADADKDPAIGGKIATELPVIIRHLLTQFADPELAKRLLLEQRDGAEALAVKQEADPVIAMCALLEFLDETTGLRVGGGNSAHDPLRFLYHFYVEYLRAEGLDRPLHRTAFGKAMKAAAKAYRSEYKTRKSNGDRVTNVRLKDEANGVLPQARLDD